MLNYTGTRDKSGNKIYVGDKFKDMLNTDLIGTVKFGRYYNCFDKKEVKEFGGHVGFFVDFGDDSIRKDLLYWTKNSSKLEV